MAGFLSRDSKGGFQPPYDGGFRKPFAGDGAGGFQPDLAGQWSPKQLAGLIDWHRSDLGITLVGSKVSAWADQSGNGRNLSQGTDANRPTYTATQFGPHAGVDFGPTAIDAFMSWTPWAAPETLTAFAVLKMRTTGAYQLFLYKNGPSLYLGGNGVDGATNRPMVYTTGPRAQWGADLVNNTNYLVKWAFDVTGGANEDYWTQVGDDTEVNSNFAEAVTSGDFASLGLDPALSTIQDLISSLAEVIIYNRRLSVGEDAAVRAYVTARYGIVM